MTAKRPFRSRLHRSEPQGRPGGARGGSTDLDLGDSLPLTCTRAGTCCFGNLVWLNPWELAHLATARGQTAREFRDRYCDDGGIRLRFDGPPGWKGLPACSQYRPGEGCSVYAARPLACRLYPLGRERRAEGVRYTHAGSTLPCLEGCPEVTALPPHTVAEFLAAQEVRRSELAHDSYMELMQSLADGAFVLLLESGLSASGDRLTLGRWRALGQEHPGHLARRLGPAWVDRLMVPELGVGADDPAAWAQSHHDALQCHAQAAFGRLADVSALREATLAMMGLALYLGTGLGADPAKLAAHWIATAKEHGARE